MAMQACRTGLPQQVANHRGGPDINWGADLLGPQASCMFQSGVGYVVSHVWN